MNPNMNMNKNHVVTRFAPSPTGFMHIGNVRTGLFSFLWARKNKGTFLLRIEDTDKEREVAGSIQHILESLKWLGISWDYGPDSASTPYGPMIQSQRLEIYKKYAEELLAKGLAYPDPYSKEELENFRKLAESEKKPFLYRNHRPSDTQMSEKWDGTKPLRLKTPTIKRMKWHDEVMGDLEAGEEALDDFVIIKGDGYPTYNFAHIVDDIEMGVTHVMRGNEFVSSTPKFLSVYEALGKTPPHFATMPPILKDDRSKKLGKRDGAKDALEFRTEGFLPEALVNFLALIGWNPGTDQEIFTLEELIAQFDLSKVQKGGGAFNETKLLWVNKEWLKRLPDDVVISEIKSRISNSNPDWSINEALAGKLKDVILERISTWGELTEALTNHEFDFFFTKPTNTHASLLWKEETENTRTISFLEHIYKTWSEVSDPNWSKETLKNTIFDYATTEGRGAVLWPLRMSLTGLPKSPDGFLVAEIIGKEETLDRIQKAINLLKNPEAKA